MNQQTASPTTTYDILARSWDCGAGVDSALFSTDGTLAVFALNDGSLALAPTKDNEPAEVRVRVSVEDGRSVIRPRSAPPPPLTRITRTDDPIGCVATAGPATFLVGTRSGAVLTMNAEGEFEAVGPHLPGPVIALDHCPSTGMAAASDGERLIWLDPQSAPTISEHAPSSPITTLAFAPDGSRIAIGGAGTLTILAVGASQEEPYTCDLPAPTTSITWSANGLWAAATLEDGGFGLFDAASQSLKIVGGFPSPVQSVAFSEEANALVASGAFRIAAWSMAAPPMADVKAGALETGRRGFVPVERVATHPKRKLVAGAFENGQIVIAQIGLTDKLLLRPSGPRTSAMAWSPDGRFLAIGTPEGQTALVSFPPQMFKG